MSDQSGSLVFRGPPDRLSSFVGLPEDVGSAEARLEGAEVRRLAVRRLHREGRPDMGRLVLRLPKSTPPGRYTGVVALGEREVPVVAEIEPRPRVEASPSRLTFEVAPGAEAAAELTLFNLGNVPFDLRGAYAFCVFDGGGIDHAFWTALANEPPDGKRRLDVLLDDLAESHGGLVEVRARAGERTIAPGESREATVTFRFSDRIQPGRTYGGTWTADGLRVRVTVRVPGAKPGEEAR